MSFHYGDNWADQVESEEVYEPPQPPSPIRINSPPTPPPSSTYPTNHTSKRYQSVQSKEASKMSSGNGKANTVPTNHTQTHPQRVVTQTQQHAVKVAGGAQAVRAAGGYVTVNGQQVQTRQKHGTLWAPHLKREEVVITRQVSAHKVGTPSAGVVAATPTSVTSALEERIRLLENTVTKQNLLLEKMHKKNKKLKQYQKQTEACVKEMRGAMAFLMKRQLSAEHGGGPMLQAIDADNKLLRTLMNESIRSPTTITNHNHNMHNNMNNLVSPRTPFSGSRLNPNATPFLPDFSSDATRTESAFSNADGEDNSGDLSEDEKGISTI